MKKIGILTFHKSINYGSVLQTWALCKILSDYNVSVINYEPRVYKKTYGLFSVSKGLKYNVNRLLNCMAIERQIQKFSGFRKSYLPLTKGYISSTISKDTFDEFDAIVIKYGMFMQKIQMIYFSCHILSVQKRLHMHVVLMIQILQKKDVMMY